jgi:FeS assembly SUF system protein
MAESPIERIRSQTLESQVVEVLRSTYDPEIPVNIYDLGLVYDIDVTPAGVVTIRMTLTSPACPVAETLPVEIQSRVGAIDGVSQVNIDIVWDPPWTPERMSETAKLELGFM